MRNLWAIHGFLGNSSDWSNCLKLKQNPKVNYVDLDNGNNSDFWKWAEQFNQTVNTSNNFLIGYSLGGRLGLHAVLCGPKIWKAAIFVSTHPGLTTTQERADRIMIDERWAVRFEHEPWERVIEDWNKQSVFASSTTPLRCEKDYSRTQLAYTLRQYSLGKQEDLKEKLKKIDIPILWITGKRDTKFSDLADNLCFKNPHSRVTSISNAGHRVPWDNPEQFNLEISDFILNLEQE